MAALNIATQLPPAINTYEQLLYLCATYLGTYVGSKTFNPLPNGEQTLINSTAIYPDINGNRWCVVSIALPLAPAYAFDTSVKPWKHVQEIIQLASPPDAKWTTN